jgi:hypothetical protein
MQASEESNSKKKTNSKFQIPNSKKMKYDASIGEMNYLDASIRGIKFPKKNKFQIPKKK